MKTNYLILLILIITAAAVTSAQTELTIKKKSTMKIPGMPDMSQMPNGMADPLKDRSSTVFIKGSRMRTDMFIDEPTKTGGKKTVKHSTIVQCDRKQVMTFNSKKKKYHVEPVASPTSASIKGAKKGGYVTIAGGVTDTGNRAKLFGFDARHLKETYTITPSKDACQKETLKIEIEGWYADIPEFACPAQRKPREFQMENNCFDDVEMKLTGTTLTGVALKEIKKITMDGMTMIMEEEATAITRTPIPDSVFDAPAGYAAANTLKEVEDDSGDDPAAASAANTGFDPAQANPQTEPTTPAFAVPKAGIERAAVGEKKPGMIRIGILKPKITTPESKNDPDSGADIAAAVTTSLIETIKAENIEAVEIESPVDAQTKSCDYTLHSNVMQKRGGGGFGIGKMVAMSAVMMAGAMVPGIGGIVASTIASQVMSQTMMKNAKAKDEFTFDYKVVGMDNAVLASAVTKKKTEKDGEDVLTPQVHTASTVILGKLKK